MRPPDWDRAGWLFENGRDPGCFLPSSTDERSPNHAGNGRGHRDSRWAYAQPALFRQASTCNCADDADSYMVLQIEHVSERSIKAICPEMRPRLGIDKLTRNANVVPGLAYAS